MANVVTPADIPLPAFLDPILDYLSQNLPAPAYSILISFLSHGLALLSALFTLFGSLFFDPESNWNAQTLLPPLIALLAAYLALLSLYRTTAWMLRISFWFIKWGTLLAALAGGAGWMLGNGGNAVGGRGVANIMAGWVLDMISDDTQHARRRSSSSRSRQQKRPKSWESYQAHRNWQYKEKDEQASSDEVADLMETVFSATKSMMKDSRWWEFGTGRQEEKNKKVSKSGSVSR
ncbi:hypothetical protein D9757_004346 [Collybiopsis confluens]|uniref:Uncharacterized protein n=1 Tax=Collybiopsis confluens TaxID=2823264 RepID=A0A8H5HUJ2_9AGAR|nr:hypothetical protein D9757_004346 [Collybiopsis confluens]